MARGRKKPIEERIAEKEEIIDSLQVRLNKEENELKALLKAQKRKEMEALHDFLKTSNLGIYEATEALQEYVSSRYNETA